MTIAEFDRRPVLDESNPDAARPAGSDPDFHADAGATITPYMFSLSTRKLTLGTCLLASIACATQTPAAADGAPRPTASRFGDLTDVVQPVNVRRLRRMFAAKGPAATAEALEKQRHCG